MLQTCNFINNSLQHRCFPLNNGKFLRTPISKNTCSVSSCFCIDSLLSSDNLLLGYEQLSYYQFNRNLSICVSLVKDWSVFYKKFKIYQLNFLTKIMIFFFFFLSGFSFRNIHDRKYPNLVRAQVQMISDPNYLVRILFER